MSEPSAREAFDPNAGGGGKLPSVPFALSADDYAGAFAKADPDGGLASAEGWMARIVKALRTPPSVETFRTLGLVPDGGSRGVREWPGLHPLVLQKVAREHASVKAIINMRVADVLRYSDLSKHPWRPGWGVTLRDGLAKPGKGDLADIRDVEQFLLACNVETGTDANARDAAGLCSFETFLAMLARDSLTYAAAAAWTDTDESGRVKAFKAIPAEVIRLCPDGLNGDKAVFAVAVDETNKVRHQFTRRQLAWTVRNPRPDPDVLGYGWPEIEMGMALIQGFTNALEMNLDVFNKNSIPNGILALHGAWGQKQVDIISRIWGNLKRGVSKIYALPAMVMPKDGKMEVLDLSMLKGNDAYYRDLMNMVAGLLCALYCFPTNRLGYKLSGQGADAAPDAATSGAGLVDTADPGLAPFLGHLERFVNERLVWTRWPHLQFRFWGKNPREDAREYEARSKAMTYGETRAMADLPPLADIAQGDNKDIAETMDLCPNDPGLAGVFQALIAAKTAKEVKAVGAEGQEGARYPSKADPAKGEAHGHMSGVRRDSAAEARSAKDA